MATSDAALPPTTAVTRSFEHLDLGRWMAAVAVASALRTAAQHPLTVAAARKRVHEGPDAAALRELLRRGFADGRAAAGGAAGGGVRALYRGLGVCVVGNAVGECAYLCIVEYTRARAAAVLPGDAQQPVRDALGGALGDATALVVTTPLSLVCNRQMTAGHGAARDVPYASAFRTAHQVVYPPPPLASPSVGGGVASAPKANFWGLFAGFSASLYVVPASAAWWGFYGVSKGALYTATSPTLARWQRERHAAAAAPSPSDAAATAPSWAGRAAYALLPAVCLDPDDNPLVNGAAGVATSMGVAWLFTPFQVLRTLMQVEAGAPTATASAASAAVPAPTTTRAMAVRVLRRDGVRGFFKGAGINAALAALDGLVFANVYEFTKWYADRTRHLEPPVPVV